MSQNGKRASSSFENLEQRTLLSAAPPKVMGFVVDYGLGDPNNPVLSENAQGQISHDTMDWDDLTQVNYFALLPNASSPYANNPAAARTVTSSGALQSLTDSGFDPSVQLPALVTDAHAHSKQIYVTIGAGDPNAIYDMDALVNTPAVFSTFATNLHNFVTQYGLDGVDLDYEPTAAQDFTVTKTQLTNFGLLIKTIKQAYPNMPLTADPLGAPVLISDANGVSTGTSALMLDSVGVQNLDEINVQAYSVQNKAQSDGILQDWADYIGGGQKDFNNVAVSAPASKLQYGIDIAPDDTSNNPAGVIEAKVDTTISKGYGGVFLFQLNIASSPSVVQRIGDEIAKDIGSPTPTPVPTPTPTPTPSGSVSGVVRKSSGAGIGGVTVYLDADNDKVLDKNERSTKTASDGTYHFTDVKTGAYIVRQILPAGTTQVSPGSGFGQHVSVADHSNLTGEDFVDNVAGVGSIRGTVKDDHGTGLKNVTVYLDVNSNGHLDKGERSTVTTGGGNYAFTSVPAGTYIVRQQVPPGYVQKSPTNDWGKHVTLDGGDDIAGQNFVDAVKPSVVSGHVKSTANKPLAGILVYLDADNSRSLNGHERSTRTDSNGFYQFTDVAPGTYIVRQQLPAHCAQVSPSNQYGQHITVGQGSILADLNFVDRT